MINSPYTFKFNHIKHFENWYEKLKTDLLFGISESWGNVFDNIEKNSEIWANLLVENIKIISGGCNKNHSCERKLHSSFYDFKLFAPTSMGNN